MSDSDIDQRLREAVRTAYANAPAVRARFDKAGVKPGDIRRVADLVKIPVLPKDELVALQQADPPFGGMLAVPMSEVPHIFFSPGPIYEPGPDEDSSVWAVTVAMLKQCGFEPGDVILNSLSYHLVPAGFLFDQAFTRLGCTVVPGGVGNSDLQLKMMGDLQVTGYVGTASFLMSLIQKAEGMGLEFKKHFKLGNAIVTAEPLSPSLRQSLTETYGVGVTNAYGTAELGMLAINSGGGPAMQLLPEPIIEVVAPDTGQPVGHGETGEIVVTNFSRAYPLIRLGTGDMAVNVDPNPGQSKQEERAIALVGRRGEAVKVRGMFLHPNQLRFAARQVGGVSAIQAIVTRPQVRDHFALRVELEEGVAEAAVTEPLKQAVKEACRVRVDSVEFVAAGTIAADAPGVVDKRAWD